MSEPLVVTFYSYKGGVGRTHALYNTALLVAAAGHRVLMVDADLEAPGLHVLGDVPRGSQAACSGFLGAWLRLERALRGADTDERVADEPSLQVSEAPALAEHVVAIPVPDSLEASRIPGDPDRVLRLMPAGPLGADEYATLLGRVDLEAAYARHDARLVANLMRRWFAAAGYEYVFVDSRTGLGPIADLCVGDLADAVVTVVTPNRQNLEGLGRFCEQVAMSRLPDARRLLVLSPMPIGERTLREQAYEDVRHHIGTTFSSSPVELPYDPRVALVNAPMVLLDPDAALVLGYRALRDRVLGIQGDDAGSMAAEVASLDLHTSAGRVRLVELGRRIAMLDEARAPVPERSLKEVGQVDTRTVLIVDMRGFSDTSRTIERTLGVDAAAGLVRMVAVLVERTLADGGFLASDVPRKLTGDGAIVVLPNPAAAHQFAMTFFHHASIDETTGRPLKQPRAEFRMGAATGELATLSEISDFAGTVVADASRLEAAGTPGAMLVDEATWSELPEGLRARYTGPEQVRGKRSEVYNAWRTVFVGSGADAGTRPEEPTDTAPRPPGSSEPRARTVELARRKHEDLRSRYIKQQGTEGEFAARENLRDFVEEMAQQGIDLTDDAP